ncbi:MAG TPA: cyclase family protein [Clostridia bacterium]|nr:cyclase family protein [Clostridia bacterium]
MSTAGPTLIDLTLPVPEKQAGQETCRLEERHLMCAELPYTGMVHHFQHDSMAGTYIDFPGHIKETDDGLRASTYPLNRLFRVPAAVIRLQRTSGSGRISADDLAGACPKGSVAQALILNALGPLRFDQILERSVYLGRDAVDWIVSSGYHLLVSDVYESNVDPQQVFNRLFAGGVSTVCHPINLHKINRPFVRLTVLPLSFPTATQLPCRGVVELECDLPT